MRRTHTLPPRFPAPTPDLLPPPPLAGLVGMGAPSAARLDLLLGCRRGVPPPPRRGHMASFTFTDEDIPQDSVLFSDDLMMGYAGSKTDDGKRRASCICLALRIITSDGPATAVYTIDPNDVDTICDSMRLLRDKIGTDEWPEGIDEYLDRTK